MDIWVVQYVIYGIYTMFCLRTVVYLLILYPNFLRSRSTFEKFNSLEEMNRFIDSVIEIPEIHLQITTRGNENAVVSRGLEQIRTFFAQLNPRVQTAVKITLVTESEEDTMVFDGKNFPFKFQVIQIPESYKTFNQTKYKARALQYMSDVRKDSAKNGDLRLDKVYIIFFDAETTVDSVYLTSVVYHIMQNQSKLIHQGPIFYSNNWFSSNIFSRQMESLRPWSCYECITSIKNKTPSHLHGSNLIVRGDIENNIGWDYGLLGDSPIITEDLYFGIKAYSKYGNEIFGWHGIRVYEQPPFSIRDSINQRIRWIRGSLQVLTNSSKSAEKSEKQTSGKIKRKLYFYGLGFMPAIILVIWMSFVFSQFLISLFSTRSFIEAGNSMSQVAKVHTTNLVSLWVVVFALFGVFLWLTSIQIGLYHNLKAQNLGKKKRFLEHISILLISPFATLVDTGTVLYVTLAWYFGVRKTTWQVTPK